ncbi:MAG TPA: hypothetical protein VKJ83_05345, partial [Actinomycetota bacterium]|nr:hypothetical protein [Actinomycetota bacterium]
GWGGEDDDLQLHLDHIRIKDVDLPYYRIAEVAVADPEPGATVDLPRLVIRLGDGEVFQVPLPAEEAERARGLIQVPEARREALTEELRWTPAPPAPVAAPKGPGLLSRLPQRLARRGVAEWVFAGALVVLALLAVWTLFLPHPAPKPLPAAALSPSPNPSPQVRTAPTHRPEGARATPGPNQKHHRRHARHKGVTGRRGSPTIQVAPVVAPPASPAQPVLQPHPSPVVRPPKTKPSPQVTSEPPPPPTSKPAPSISTSQPAPSPSISVG